MGNAAAVCGIEPVADVDRDLQRQRRRQGPSRDPPGERFAFEVLEHQVIDAILTADVVQGADVRVVDLGDGARLALEALARFRVVGHAGRKHLDRDEAVEAGIARPEDLAHPARAQRLENLVRTETRPA